MAEEITEFNDEELTRKLKAKRRIRGALIVVNFVLFGYLAYQIGASVVNLVRTANEVEGVVKLEGKTQKDSLKIYKNYVDQNKICNADFAIYGDKIYFTSNNFNKEDIKSIGNVQLIKIESNKSDTIIERDSLFYDNIENSLSYGVSLFKDKNNNRLKKGDYLFYHDYVSPNEYGEVIKVTNQLNMKYEMYSLKGDDGQRVKATIYAYKNNPALVMNIDHVTTIPDDCYDAIIIGDNTEKIVREYEAKGFEKILAKSESEITDKELFSLQTNELIKVIDDNKENDERIIYSSNLLDDGLSKFDEDDQFIISNAGYAMSRGLEYEFNNEHYAGKLTYIIDLEN